MNDDSSDGSLGSPQSPPQAVYGDTIATRLRSSPSLSSFDDSDPKKKRNNLAVFGAKLTQSAVANFKKIDQQQPSLSIFRSSKTDLKSLRMKTDLGIQTSLNAARSSINDRSPMTRTSKELDRIANLGSPGSFLGSPQLDPPPGKRHHMFHKKTQSPQTVLSSSASNSRLGSEGSVYTFQHTPNLHLENSFKTSEECQQTIDYTWSLLSSKIQSIFSDNSIRIPVEDLNTLVTIHFGAHVSARGSPLEMIERVSELLVTGFKMSRRTSSSNDILERYASTWRTFFSQTLLMLEAVFLPLQLEFEGTGSVLEEQGLDFWAPLQKMGPLSIRRLVLIAFRDTVILPDIARLKEAMNLFAINEGSSEIAASLNQCVNFLCLIKSSDSNQTKIDELAVTLRQSWMCRPRFAKDRRGLVLRRSDSCSAYS